MRYQGQTIDQATLDKCLIIDSIPSDNISRNRRSKILQEILKNYSDVVTIDRVRDKEDMRLFRYKVGWFFIWNYYLEVVILIGGWTMTFLPVILFKIENYPYPNTSFINTLFKVNWTGCFKNKL